MRDGAGGKEKDSQVSKERVKGVDQERDSGKVILVRKKSAETQMRECIEGLDNNYKFSISGAQKSKGIGSSGELNRDELMTEHS